MELKQYRVLLVDDDQDDYLITKDLLAEIECSSYELEWVSTYEEAVLRVEERAHDVYLIDYRLGARTGLDLLRELLARGCREPIILLTGQGDRGIDMEAMRTGAADYLVKGQLGPLLLERSIRYSIRHRENEKKLTQLAEFDALTGLPNRHLLQDRLRQAILLSKRQGSYVGVMFLDLDRFKRINDTLGHSFGDELLKGVARRLSRCTREEVTVARLGGDEFVIILPNLYDPKNASLVADRILDVLSHPFQINGQEVFTATSIGISLYPFDGQDVEDLLKKADSAMYQAKSLGGKSYKFYSSEMNHRTLEHFTIEAELHRALERNEFLLYYQPQLNLETGEISGAEALLRWQPSHRPMVSPGEFIPLLEETGLIAPVGEWVLREGVRQLSEWQQSGLRPITLSVNISSRQLRDVNLVRLLEKTLTEREGDSCSVTLEFTETMVMENIQKNVDLLHALKKMNIGLSMDDFGTGYSSLSSLKHFPFGQIKIDRTFVSNIGSNFQDEAIIRAIIAMAQSMGMSVVAEGVETEKQLNFLKENGCNYAQGYLVARPLPAFEFAFFLDPPSEPCCGEKTPARPA